MTDREAYLEEIKTALRVLHGCEAEFIYTVPVKEMFQGKIAWEGDVEHFKIFGHPKTTSAYAWGYPKENGKGWEITTVLEIPPVESAQMAVKVAIAARAQQARN